LIHNMFLSGAFGTMIAGRPSTHAMCGLLSSHAASTEAQL
jgi:hypothetical protein